MKEVYARHLVIFSDSQLIVNQINSECQAKGEKMIAYLGKVQELQRQFDTIIITQVHKLENSNANSLAHLVTSLEDNILKTRPVEVLETPSVGKTELVA